MRCASSVCELARKGADAASSAMSALVISLIDLIALFESYLHGARSADDWTNVVQELTFHGLQQDFGDRSTYYGAYSGTVIGKPIL